MQRYTFIMTDDDDDGSESDITVTYTPKDDFVSWDEPLKRFLRFLNMTGYVIDVDDFIEAANQTMAKREIKKKQNDFTDLGRVRLGEEYKFEHPDEWSDVIRGD